MGTVGELTAVFLQARIDSTRLPGKILLPLAERTVIEHVMTALKDIPADIYALLTDKDSAPKIQALTEGCGFELYIGSKDDVLARYAGAARAYGANLIIRATGDNPLVSAALASEILALHTAAGADYSAYTGGPLGTGVEVVRAGVLHRAVKEAQDPYEREHVTPFAYRRQTEFVLNRPRVPDSLYMPEARVTLDTEADYSFIRAVFAQLYTGRPISTDNLVHWLKSPAGRRAAVSDRAAS